MTDSVPGSRVMVDRDACVGTGDCARLAPLAFRVSERDFISVVLPGAATTDLALLREAAAACPMEAIHVTVDDGGEAIAP